MVVLGCQVALFFRETDIFRKNTFWYLEHFILSGAVLLTTSSFKVFCFRFFGQGCKSFDITQGFSHFKVLKNNNESFYSQ